MTINLLNLQKKVLQLAIVAGFTGTLWLTFSVGPFHLFPFRVILICMWFLIFIKTAKIYTNRIQVKMSLKFLLFWLIYAMVSMVWAVEKVESIKHIIFLFLNVSLIFFIVYLSDSLKDIAILFRIWLVIYIILLPIGFWEVITGDHLSNSGLLNVDDGYEFYKFAPTTVFGNQNDYATLISLTFPMLYVGAIHTTKFYKKIFLHGVLGLSILMLMLTTSRANYIGVFLGFVFWFVFLIKLNLRLKILGIGLFLILFIAINLSKDDLGFLANIVDDFNTLKDTDATGNEVRGNLIMNAIYFVIITGGFGVGAGNLEYYMKHHPKYFVSDITNVHNWWAEIFGNYGVYIFVGYMIFYINIIYTLWKLRKVIVNRTEKFISESLMCGLVAFSISSLSSSSVMAFNPQWIFFGLALAFINYKRIECKNRIAS